ncbi:MAG: hypothetical protein NUV57_03250 [archaeon]|nr:hypothetical protein [archaeon]
MVTEVSTKKMKKEIHSLNKKLIAEKKKSGKFREGIVIARKKTAKTFKTVTAKTANLNTEMNRLKNNVEELAKKKTPKKQLSEYNLFMSRQLKDGNSFNQAIKLWKVYKKGVSTVQKKATKKKITKPKVVTNIRTVIRKAPVTKVRTIVRELNQPEIFTEMRSILSEFNSEFSTNLQELKKTLRETDTGIITSTANTAVSDEHLAIDIISVYFQEVHRLGMKRKLELDDVVNAYFDTLTRIKGMKMVIKSDPPLQPPTVSDKLSSHK